MGVIDPFLPVTSGGFAAAWLQPIALWTQHPLTRIHPTALSVTRFRSCVHRSSGPHCLDTPPIGRQCRLRRDIDEKGGPASKQAVIDGERAPQ